MDHFNELQIYLLSKERKLKLSGKKFPATNSQLIIFGTKKQIHILRIFSFSLWNLSFSSVTGCIYLTLYIKCIVISCIHRVVASVYVKLREGRRRRDGSVLGWTWWVRVVVGAVWRARKTPRKGPGLWGGNTRRSHWLSWRRTPSPPNTRRVHHWPFFLMDRQNPGFAHGFWVIN